MVLVLDRAGGDGGDEDCEDVATLDRLADCLRVSDYEFDVSPHVSGHGTISPDTLRREPFSSVRVDEDELLGRQFVTFHESLAELRTDDDDFLRLDGAPMSSGGALDDRVKRGLAVFTYWVQNKDAKDVNNKGVIERSSGTYFDYMHDLGSSLGNLHVSGLPSLLQVGDAFVRRRGRSIRFDANMLYVPEAFERATHADAAWMARKIVDLPRQTILDAVAASSWPDFQQEVTASRLIARRNDLARLFELGPPMEHDAGPRAVSLREPADRLRAVERYGVAAATGGDEAQAVALLERLMAEAGVAIENGSADYEDRVSAWVTAPADPGEERVLRTARCKSSVLVALLERTVHPTGLSRRLHRRTDGRPLASCEPGRAR
jgi:hypothetical protein